MGANINQMSEVTLFKCNLLHSKAGRGTPPPKPGSKPKKVAFPFHASIFWFQLVITPYLSKIKIVTIISLYFQIPRLIIIIFATVGWRFGRKFPDIRIWTQNAFFILYVIGTETKKSLHNHPSQIFQQQGEVYMRLMKANVWSNSRIPHINTLLT